MNSDDLGKGGGGLELTVGDTAFTRIKRDGFNTTTSAAGSDGMPKLMKCDDQHLKLGVSKQSRQVKRPRSQEFKEEGKGQMRTK